MLLGILPITITQNMVTATNKVIMSAKNLQTLEATGWNSQDKMAQRLWSFQTQQQEYRAANCGRKISFIRIEKSPFSRWTKNSKVDTSSGSHRKNEKKDGTKKKKTHTHTAMNKSASLTPVQEPSTVVCMIVTSLPQLLYWLYQLPTVGKGHDKHQPANWVSAAIPEAMGRLSHTTG